MRSIGCVVVLLLSIGAAAPASAQRAEAVFQRANEAYFQGDYEGAIEGYELLVDSGIDDPDVAYDLATANARLGRWGHAIRWFEHALRLSPGDEDAERGLAAARSALARRQAEAHGESVQMKPSFGETVVRPIAEDTLAWLVLFLNFAFFGVLVARRFLRGETPRLALGIAIPLVGALLSLAGVGLAIKAGTFQDGDPAIVLEQDATLREGPDPRARPRGRADEGEPARILHAHGEWVRVKLPGGREGWMRADQVGAIGSRRPRH